MDYQILIDQIRTRIKFVISATEALERYSVPREAKAAAVAQRRVPARGRKRARKSGGASSLGAA